MKVLSKNKVDRLIKYLNIDNEFSSNIDIWISWLRKIPSNYETLVDKGIDKGIIDAKLRTFFVRFLEQEIYKKLHLKMNTVYPAIKLDKKIQILF